jgi:CRP-like cAMP-binding protein
VAQVAKGPNSENTADIEFLIHHGWLSHTPKAFARGFLENCHWRSVKAGTALSHAGDREHGMMGIASGVTTVTSALSAPDMPMITIAHPGTWFGYIPMFSNFPRVVSLVARTDVRLAVISEREVERALANNPTWWRSFGALGIIYGNTAMAAACDLMIRDSKRRCISTILRIANCRFEDCPEGLPVEAPLSQEELAAMSNLSRTSVSRILRELEDEGSITLGYRGIILHDAATLRAIVDNV